MVGAPAFHAAFLPAGRACRAECDCALPPADARWGKAAHLTFFFFCILTNILVTSMLLLGGAAVINALTGMNIYAVRRRLSSPVSDAHAVKTVLWATCSHMPPHCLGSNAGRWARDAPAALWLQQNDTGSNAHDV